MNGEVQNSGAYIDGVPLLRKVDRGQSSDWTASGYDSFPHCLEKPKRNGKDH